MQKIAVLGATGRTGQWIVKEALNQGYGVRALVRDTGRLDVKHPNLMVIRGNPSSPEDLASTMQECVAVVSALNISRKNEWWPWSELSAPSTFLSEVAAKIVAAARQVKVRRVLVVSAWGTLETKKDVPAFFRWAMDYTKIDVVYLDHEQQEVIWEKSDLDWTIVRPVGLTNGTAAKEVVIRLETTTSRPKLLVSRRMVARFIVSCIEKECYIRQKPIISY